MVPVAKEKRQIDHKHLWDKAPNRSRRGDHEIDGTQLQAFNEVPFVSQLGGGKDVDLDLTAGLLSHEFGVFSRPDVIGMVG